MKMKHAATDLVEIEDDSFSDEEGFDSTTSPTNRSKDDERDEVQEVHKTTQSETRRLHIWRVVVTLVLLMAALAVTLTTYKLLEQEQIDNFETAFEQFSRTVADAALDQRTLVIDALRAYATDVTIGAVAYPRWPMVEIPFYESISSSFRKLANSEISSFIPIVDHEDRDLYTEFVDTKYQQWYDEGHMTANGNLDGFTREKYKNYINARGGDGYVEDVVRPTYFPIQLNTPPPVNYGSLNFNLGTAFGAPLQSVRDLRNETMTSAVGSYVTAIGSILTKARHDKMHDPASLKLVGDGQHPHQFYWHPVYESLTDPDQKVVGIVSGVIALDASSRNLLPEGTEGIYIVIRNNCDQVYTYVLSGPRATYLGEADLHEPKYDTYEVVVEMTHHENPLAYTAPGHCLYTMHIYPSQVFEDSYHSNTPILFAGVVALTFVLVAVVFVIYDIMVQRRNEKIVANAAKSNAIVTELFPGKIRDQIVAQNETGRNKKKSLKSFVDGAGGDSVVDTTSKPLADLFLETTILFADISGFTAWSSVRDPQQVFMLLENLYRTFDLIAKRRRVFKVETVGDCYVAATGIPTYNPNHASVMIRFAHELMARMGPVTKQLEKTLGPDTSDLDLRIGIHSGPVTAGVLRGERARFQLFGDTVNTTARIEASGQKGRIHVSQATAELLIKAGKANWFEKREDIVNAKGKGLIETYWLKHNFSTRAESVVDRDETSSVGDLFNNSPYDTDSERKERLIDWNVDVLLGLLKRVVARRQLLATTSKRTMENGIESAFTSSKTGVSFLDDVKEIITLPAFDGAVADPQDPDDIEIPRDVQEQLRSYVSSIAALYRDNAFHNFEHASHVLMSVNKLMSRIVATDVDEGAGSLHDHTYGITSDPLTGFACAFSAMIHDADHTGAPNAQLIAEKSPIADTWDRSIAEQNSLNLSLNLLLSNDYKDLFHTICATKEEAKRFHSLLVNIVLATDIVDKGLKELRNARWDKAFKTETAEQFVKSEDARDGVNRKATIVLEHLIQASDVSHTMQHWHVFRKWNENLFKEMYVAYKQGRAASDPSVNWYKSEIGFFDYYVIPLAKKLKECGVFGVSSGEYLNYAMHNRKEWELKGEAIVTEMIAKYKDIEVNAKENDSFDFVSIEV